MFSSENNANTLAQIEPLFANDIPSLQQCKDLLDSLLNQKQALEQEVTTTVALAVNEANGVVNQCRTRIKECGDHLENIADYMAEVNEVREELSGKFDKLVACQSTLQYVKVIQQVDYICDELQKDFAKKDDEKCVTHFANLTEICRILSDCPANNLKVYIKQCILHWHNLIKDKLSKDYDEILKQMKWPFLSTNFSIVTPIESNVEKLQIIAEYLLQIEIPSEINLSTVDPPTGILNHFQPTCLPIHFLIQPLRKRFIYHFYGNRKTNRTDKPEWYFTQVLTWIRDHQDYVDQWLQPVIDKFGLHHIDAKNDFMRGLVQLAAEKLNSDLPTLQFDDFSFSHSIDEALGFDKELRDVYKYPAGQPGVVVILTQAFVMVKWLIMEKKYAIEKMDSILSPNSAEAFDLLATDVDDLKITTCADAFITILQTITERYECLPQPGHRLQFLDLQLELLDDFRVRLLQIVNAEEGDYMESKVPLIANTLYYVEGVLVDWGAMLHYLTLYYYKSQSNGSTLPQSPLSEVDEIEKDSLFMETLSLYRHFRRDLLSGLAEAVLMEVRKRSWDYRSEKWNSMKSVKEMRYLSLTPSACPMFEVLSKRLHQLQKKLQSKLFTIVWRNIACQLDTYLFEDLVMDNRFNNGGAMQLKFDVTRNLLPLFAQFTENPGNYFNQIIESCNLLNLSKGSALLLRDTLLALEGATGVEDTRGKTLKEVGVINFTPKMAVKILNQRTDIINRLHD